MPSLFDAPAPKVSSQVLVLDSLPADQKARAIKLRLAADVKAFWNVASQANTLLKGGIERVSAQFAEPTPENPLLGGLTRAEKLALFGEDAAEIAARKAKIEQAIALLTEATAFKA